MKRTKTNNVSSQNSKISDFFNKIPNQLSQKNGTNNKRKVSDVTQSNEGTILNSVTNLPGKCSQKLSPTYKKTKHDENCVPKMLDPITMADESFHNNLNKNIKVITPEKSLKPSVSMKTPTPKKSPASISLRKCTPKKLFEKSPRKVEEFNVEILENFVKVSPSTSNRKILIKTTPTKNHIQGSIVEYMSPAATKRCSPAQICNETTPSKSPRISNFLSPKFKAKLNFSDSNFVSSNKIKMEEIKITDVKLESDSFLDEEFGLMMSFEEESNNLDFGQLQHCKILKVNHHNGRIVLKLKSDKDNSTGVCDIEEFWASGNHFKEGDHVFIKAEKKDNSWVVDNNRGWLVYEPDLLIPCTTVVGSLYCKRRSVLADRFKGLDSNNRIMVVGILTHTLLQQALKNKLKTANEVETLLKNILSSKDTVKSLYESNLTLDEIETELRTFVPKLVTFLDEYVNCKSIGQSNLENWRGKICGIEDIEENLWCPELGIKGKIDVTTRTESGVMPLELKTGRATVSLEHRGQVVLYIMMMNKFGYNVSSGLLMYLREGILKEIKATPQEKRDVMILRNELAYFLTRKVNDSSEEVKPPELPEPLNNHRACPKCPYNLLCTSYLKLEDHNISTNKVLQDVQKNTTSHLAEQHLDYFFRWSNMLSLEAGNPTATKSIEQIYTVPPKKREASGKCISNVKVTSVGGDQNGLYLHTFEKENPVYNLAAYDIVENNYVVVSTDTRPAVATGFVTEISSSQVSILLDRNLNLKYQRKFFHLDTYDANNTFTFNMTSLALLLENTPRAAELRNIIIDKAPPAFRPKLPSVVAKKAAPILCRLNCLQQKAVLKALSAKQFLLIKGMPGTGKSATIVALIQLLVELDKTVLVTSHTHSAIDNICTRLQKREIDFIRLGSNSKIDASIKANTEASLIENCTTPDQLEEVYNSYKVIAVTCLGSGHPLLTKRTVDVCIVDESTQVLQTSVLRTLFAAATFVLIGDPNQLAPLAKSRTAIKLGMAESLFERLENSKGTITLNLNYRMNKTITELANILTYEGELKTANDEVANRTLQIQNPKSIQITFKDHLWLLKAMDTSLAAAVQLIDTGPVWGLPQDVKWLLKNTRVAGGYDVQNCVNIYEVAIVVTLVKALIKGGVSGSDIGVIATYRAQVMQISDLLGKYNIDVSTVDQFQGRDKSLIIYSCTKSVDPSKVSTNTHKFELLEDKRRLTVAITRAKRKLIIVGDVNTLQRYKTFSIILPTLKKNYIKFDSPWTFINSL